MWTSTRGRRILSAPDVTACRVGELAEAGVARVSVGDAFAFAALGAVVEAARELHEQGTAGYLKQAAIGGRAAREAFN